MVYVHTRQIKDEKGDKVPAGEVVAKMGNNGTSRSPHTHGGAWKGETPYQIKIDLYAKHRDK